MITYVLSDIHIGDNYKTCRYQTEVHYEYLDAIVKHIINSHDAKNCRVVLLGDIFDFWMYPSNYEPPGFSDIVRKNEDVFGPGGLFPKLIDSVHEVVYVNGNHDMNVTRADIESIKGSATDKLIKYAGFNYTFDNVCYQHGSEFSFSCAKDEFHLCRLPPPYDYTPLGYFITRLGMDAALQAIESLGPNQTMADLDNSAFNSALFHSESAQKQLEKDLAKLLTDPIRFLDAESIVKINFDVLLASVNANRNTKVIFPKGFGSLTYGQVEDRFMCQGQNWKSKRGKDFTVNAIYKSDVQNDLSWAALDKSITEPTVIFGHTHVYRESGSLHKLYVNDGFDSPSRPDFDNTSDKAICPTFISVETKGSVPVITSYKVDHNKKITQVGCVNGRPSKEKN